jgi:hypothetical protein
MAIGIGGLMKLARANIGADELAELLEAIGIEASFTRIGPGDARGEFEALWLTATEAGANIMRLEMKMKNGERFAGILVLTEPGKPRSQKT